MPDSCTTPRTIAYDWLRYGHPHRQQQRLRCATLETLGRFGLLRAIDLAAALAPERARATALSVAQRQLRRLIQQRLIERATLAHQTVYALRRRGVQELEHLRELQEDAGLIRRRALRCIRLRDRSNPQHHLLMAQTVIAAEARGWIGWTEAELRTMLKHAPLQVELDDGTRKGLWPDALLLAPVTIPNPQATTPGTSATPSTITTWRLYWIEIDRSRRGSQRLADLVALVRARGQLVRCPQPSAHDTAATLQLPLARIVVLSASSSIARANVAYLQPRVGVGMTGERALKPLGSNLWSVLADVRLSKPGPDGCIVARREVARLIVQPWPDPTRGAWFDNHALPWTLAQGAWPPAQPLQPA